MDAPGIKVLLHKHPKYCVSWSPYAIYGWYIGPSFENCCYHQIWIPSTNSVCIGQAVSWFHQKLIMPTATATNILIATAKKLTAALKNPAKIL